MSRTDVTTQFSAALGRSLFNFAYVADIFACRSRNGVLLHVCVCVIVQLYMRRCFLQYLRQCCCI